MCQIGRERIHNRFVGRKCIQHIHLVGRHIRNTERCVVVQNRNIWLDGLCAASVGSVYTNSFGFVREGIVEESRMPVTLVRCMEKANVDMMQLVLESRSAVSVASVTDVSFAMKEGNASGIDTWRLAAYVAVDMTAYQVDMRLLAVIQGMKSDRDGVRGRQQT